MYIVYLFGGLNQGMMTTLTERISTSPLLSYGKCVLLQPPPQGQHNKYARDLVSKEVG